VRLEPGERAYRALLVDARAAAGDVQGADAAAAEIERAFGATAALSAQRGYLAMRLGRPADAADRFAQALAQDGLSAAQRREATLTRADALSQAGRPREAADALAPYAGEAAYDVQSRRAAALTAAQDDAAAAPVFAQAAALAATPEDKAFMLRSRIVALTRLGQRAEARQAFDEAYRSGALAPSDPVDLGMIALSVGDDRTAQALFDKAPDSPKLAGRAALDAAYSAKRVRRDEAAVRYFGRGLDAVASGDLSLDPTTAYAIRRDVADISRVWGANGLVSYGAAGVAAGGAPLSGGRGVTQAGGEVYTRLGGYRNGAPVEAFARVFETVAAETGDPTGAQTAQGWVGLRWKPFRQANLVLEGSRMIKLGERARDDWMVRAAYSAGHGMDIDPVRRSWPMWNLYGDVARIVDYGQTLGVVDARAGWAVRAGDSEGWIVAPFVGINYAYDSSFARESALGAGPGVVVRRWFRGDSHAAPRSYVEASVQYRARLDGDRRAEGVFATFSIAY